MNAARAGLFSAVRGPIIMITIGVLFLLDKLTPFGFGQTWPIILIVVGALTLGGRSQVIPPPPPGSYGPGSGPYPPPPPHAGPPPGVRR